MGKIVLLGGPFDRVEANIRQEPPRIQIGDHLYERIDDPDTGQPLGAYVTATREGVTA